MTTMLDESDYQHERTEQHFWRLASEIGLSRRDLLTLAAAGVPLIAGARALTSVDGIALAEGVPSILKPLPPEWFIDHGTNAEMRWEAMRGLGESTPAERFFVRNHTSTPMIDPATYRLQVFGDAIDHAAAFSLDALLALPSTDVTAFIECAGNGRSLFSSQQGTPVPGTPWKLGAVGVARWRGVLLSEVLGRLGVSPNAVDVMPAGLDPVVVSGGVDQGHVRRPLPISKALDDVILAYEMNGSELPPDHGFPVRLVVPGWVGIASIKWVGSIEVSTKPLFSPWNTSTYRMFGPEYPDDSPPLGAQQVKSAFELGWGAAIPAADQVELHGRSWSGGGPIKRVEVSTDGGATWQRAQLYGPNRPHAWVRWSLPWTEPERGEHELLARATDAAQLTQPDTVPYNQYGYQFWAVAHHPVTIV